MAFYVVDLDMLDASPGKRRMNGRWYWTLAWLRAVSLWRGRADVSARRWRWPAARSDPLSRSIECVLRAMGLPNEAPAIKTSKGMGIMFMSALAHKQ